MKKVKQQQQKIESDTHYEGQHESTRKAVLHQSARRFVNAKDGEREGQVLRTNTQQKQRLHMSSGHVDTDANTDGEVVFKASVVPVERPRRPMLENM